MIQSVSGTASRYFTSAKVYRLDTNNSFYVNSSEFPTHRRLPVCLIFSFHSLITIKTSRMSLPPVGDTISMSQVRQVFGLTNPVSLSHLYGRGPNIPTSNAISLSASLGGKAPWLKARFVRLELTNDGFLNLARCIVRDNNNVDVARTAVATMSDAPYENDSYQYGAWRILDGNIDTFLHTNDPTIAAWVEIDLGSEYNIRSVQVDNRQDDFSHSAGRIKGLQVRLLTPQRSLVYLSNRFHGPSGSTNWQDATSDAFRHYRVDPPATSVNAW
jgi:hypothetical protein